MTILPRGVSVPETMTVGAGGRYRGARVQRDSSRARGESSVHFSGVTFAINATTGQMIGSRMVLSSPVAVTMTTRYLFSHNCSVLSVQISERPAIDTCSDYLCIKRRIQHTTHAQCNAKFIYEYEGADRPHLSSVAQSMPGPTPLLRLFLIPLPLSYLLLS